MARVQQDAARAIEAATAAAAANSAGRGVGGGGGISMGASSAMRLPALPATLATAATTSAAAAGGGMAASNAFFSTGVGGAAEILRTTKMVSVLPPGLDESSPRVSKIYDKFGRWKSLYRISSDPVASPAETVNGVGRGGGGGPGGGITPSSSPHGSASQQGHLAGMVVSPQNLPAARANGGGAAITNPVATGMPSTPFVGAAAGVGRSSSTGSPPTHGAHSSIPVAAGAARALNGGGAGGGGGGWDVGAMKAMMQDDVSMAASRSEDGINLKNVSILSSFT